MWLLGGGGEPLFSHGHGVDPTEELMRWKSGERAREGVLGMANQRRILVQGKPRGEGFTIIEGHGICW